jgi:nicotinate phosphoribosyltransferase
VEWGEKALAHYEAKHVDPRTKRLVFSDGLNINKAIDLYDRFADRVRVGFGIGTNLTNDVGFEPLNIVMKLTGCNGKPVAKLSDSPGKTLCKDEEFVARLKRVFEVE